MHMQYVTNELPTVNLTKCIGLSVLSCTVPYTIS